MNDTAGDLSRVHWASALAILLWFLGLHTDVGLCNDANWEQRFRTEYPAAVNHIESAFGSIQLKTKREVPQPDREEPLVEQHAYYANGENLRLDTLETAGGERARVATPTRSFRLVKSDGTSSYVVEELDVSTYQTARESIRLFAKLPHAAFCIFEVPFLEFVQDERFSLIAAEEVEHDGKSMVKITWQVPDWVADVPRGEYVAGGWVILSPDESWVIYEYFYNFRMNVYPDSGIHTVLEYAESVDGVPIPKSITRASVTSEGRRIAERYESVALITEPAAMEQFQLSAFEIPNNVGRGGSSVSRYRQLFIAFNFAFVCGLLVFIFVRRRSRNHVHDRKH